MRAGIRNRIMLAAAALLVPVPGAAVDDQAAPRAVVLVLPGDPSLEVDAARIQLELGRSLRRSHGLKFVEPDEVLGASHDEPQDVAGARRVFEQGRRAYDELEPQQAIELLEQVVAGLEADLSWPLQRELLTNALIYLGASHQLVGQQDRGMAFFRRALVFNRKAELNPMLFPPTMAAAFKTAAVEVQRGNRGGLVIRSKPAGAQVWVDGLLRGIAPLSVEDLPEGDHYLRLSLFGHQGWGAKAEVLAGSQEVITQQLEPRPGLERFAALAGAAQREMEQSEFPESVGALMEWFKVDRLFLMDVGLRDRMLVVRARYFDRARRRCLKAAQQTFMPEDASFRERLDLFFSSLYMDLGGRAITTAGETGDEQQPGLRDDDDSDEPGTGAAVFWKTWWFWTAVGVVVVGGASTALALTLGGDGGPTAGDVIFRF